MTSTSISEHDPRRIDYLPLADLTPDPRNPKAHDEGMIHASIGRFGMLDLIVRDGRTGHIISGHGRKKALMAMEEAGETPPEGVKVDPDTGAWLVPVATGWSSRTDSEAAAALIAMNRTTELGGWVDDALLNLLDELADDENGDGLIGVGYGQAEISVLRDRLESLSGEQAGDPWGEWDDAGMPKYENENQLPFKQIIVSFDNDEDVEEFARLLGWPSIRKSGWYPWKEDNKTTDREYVIADSAEAGDSAEADDTSDITIEGD